MPRPLWFARTRVESQIAYKRGSEGSTEGYGRYGAEGQQVTFGVEATRA
jgi:hypothetical protein